jgi:trehalose 6-phosphate phosphatase
MNVTDVIGLINELLQGRHLFVVLDRDGTLTPIVQDPDQSRIDESILDSIFALADFPTVDVAILSARGCIGLKNDFGDDRLILAGNYGIEIFRADDIDFVHPTAHHAEPRLQEVKAALIDLTGADTNAMLEDHIYSLCLHWHLTPEDHLDKVHDRIASLKKKYCHLDFKDMPTSYEVQPPIDWDKSFGIEQLQLITGYSPDESLYLYAGDTDSDEPAFRWVNLHGGITVRVGETEKTHARFRLSSPDQVGQLLSQLITLIRNSR